MILTPEQVEEFIEVWRGVGYIDISAMDGFFGDYGPEDVLDTLADYLALKTEAQG